MIIRIVKMTFQPDKTEEFLHVFNESKERIRNMPGCTRLELLRETGDSPVFFTYSFWNSASDLENYRRSELFAGVWAKTKVLFASKAEAWSVDQLTVLP